MSVRALQPDCSYTVQRGDFQAVVAREFNVTMAELRAANCGQPWQEGARWSIPGHECLIQGKADRGQGMARNYSPSPTPHSRPGLSDLVPPGSDVPQTTVAPNVQVKVQMRAVGNNDGTADNRISDYLRAAGYTVVGVDTASVGNYFSGVVSVVVSTPIYSTLWLFATTVVNAVRGTTTFAITPGSITAELYGAAPGGSGTPGSTGYGAIPSTPVNVGDQVKVQLNGSSALSGSASDGERGMRIANLLGVNYRVIGVDVAGMRSLGGFVSVVVEATRPSTLAYIAADVNRAVSTVYSVSQQPGGIGASFYSRAAAGTVTSSPGVNPGAVAPDHGIIPIPGTGAPGPAPNAPSIFDELAKSLGLSTGLPLTGAVVAGIAVIGVLIFLKS